MIANKFIIATLLKNLDEVNAGLVPTIWPEQRLVFINDL